MDDEYDGSAEDYYDEPEPPERRRDPKTDEAKAALLDLFEEDPTRVYYGRQIEVLLEKEFFHWITLGAAGELEEEGKIVSVTVPLLRRVPAGTLPGAGEPVIRLFWSRQNRYPRRAGEQVRRLVAEFSQTAIGRALGLHGEQMFDAALPRAGFVPVASDVREFDGKRWTKTEHDLDRVFVRDGIAYGAEVKNTLPYIDRAELAVKLELCQALGLRPLFIVRMAPKSYIERVRQAGGYTLVFKWQLYPHGFGDLTKRIREVLGLPVDTPARIADGTVQRFLSWHRKTWGV